MKKILAVIFSVFISINLSFAENYYFEVKMKDGREIKLSDKELTSEIKDGVWFLKVLQKLYYYRIFFP